MCTGERPIGAAKGKPTNTIALRPPHPTPPPPGTPNLSNLSFSSFRFWGKLPVPKAPNLFVFFGLLRGKFFLPYVSIFLWRI